MWRLAFVLLGLFITYSSFSQCSLEVRVMNKNINETISGATVSVQGMATKVTDSSGKAVFNLPVASYTLTVSHVSYKDSVCTVNCSKSSILTIYLSPIATELEDVVVQSSRNGQLASTAPIKVEVLGIEEMNEESTIKPASIASIIGDLSSVQIQQSSSVSGNSYVRIQGLEPRHTLILRDGMPLYEGLNGSFGILSMPPLDIQQVELIKGPASTLYGGGAIAGLLNVISKKPTFVRQAIATINGTTLGEKNINFFTSHRNTKIGYTLFGGVNQQPWKDINKDGFSEVPGIKSLNIHPRLFIYPSSSQTIILDASGVVENRRGGDMVVLEGKQDPSHSYFEKLYSVRKSGQAFYTKRFTGNRLFNIKAGASSFNWNQTSNSNFFKASQLNYYSEISLLFPYGKSSFVMGTNLAGERFEKGKNTIALLNNFSYNTLGFYAQNTWVIKDGTVLEAGLRYDVHNKYRGFLLPKVSLFHKVNMAWSFRTGLGYGYKVPNPLSVQNTDVSLALVRPLSKSIMAETSVGGNADVTYQKKLGSTHITCTESFFTTHINHPIVSTTAIDNSVQFVNMPGQLVSYGFDTYIKCTIDDLELYAGYTYTIAKRNYLTVNSFMPLTPRNRAAFTAVREWDELGLRIGLEGSYNGMQFRSDGTKTPGYYFAAAMIDKKLSSHFHIVLNGENLLNYKQSKVEPLVEGSTIQPVFRELWGPVEGRVINLAIRYSLK